MLKDIVNYFQVTSIAFKINFEWSLVAFGLLMAQEMVADCSPLVSLDCILPNILKNGKPIWQVDASAFLPIAMGTLISLYCLVDSFSMHHSEMSAYLHWHCVTLLLCLSTLAYLDITETLLRIVYCVEVDVRDPSKA